MKPLLSIIIPTYNEESDVEKTISQFADLHIPHEVIVSDTQSTDKTVEIAKRLADKVLLLPLGKRHDASSGRNYGAAAAQGTFLVFLDCGVLIPHPNSFFERAQAAFEKDPGLVGVSVQIQVEPPTRTTSDAVVSWLMDTWFVFLNNVGVGIASGKFQMVTADAFRKVGGFNEHFSTAEDVDFFGRIRKIGRTRIIWSLAIFHSGRRFHTQGAWYTLLLWIKNAVFFWLFKKPSEKWKPIR